jgi:predicted GNAT family N-acyltransferase
MRACYAVRREVFVDEQAVPEELELDAYDATALHLLALAPDGEPAGTARMMAHTPLPGQAKIGRVAVRSRYRGQGLASSMMGRLEDEARVLGLREVVLDAQVSVIAMYEKLGYRAHGPVFDDAGIDHRKMSKLLLGLA